MSVVLAADSASTISYYDNGKLQQRYFKGANKVFQLSNAHPVGLMIYGNAEIMGVPWELVIKAFRKHLDNSSFDSVEGYAKAFQQFLNDSQQFFPKESRDESFKNSIKIETAICCNDFNNRAADDAEFDEGHQLATLEELLANLEFKNGLDQEFLERLLHEWPNDILEELKNDENGHFHQHFADRTDAQLRKIIELAITLKAKKLHESPTGLVFAGFGDSSVYPEMYVAKNTGFLERELIMADIEKELISHGMDSYISGFAQSSMADTFIIGFDEQAFGTIQGVQRQALPDVLDPFVTKLGGSIERTERGAVLKDGEGNVLFDEQSFSDVTTEALRPVGNKILGESRQNHGEPLERVISMLPVEEMAELAETMVDLQSLKEKVTRPSETVGGPVDVAIITKNEGLIWKKRKHFFDISLNQRYLQRLHTKD
ncbi:hypothetical protein [uncultured Roseovarius sp.]|uniref:hypothetical protein n=1 Tax=uncultured Roseovarius sp. TaxID=293344 RepID=UPI0025D1421B|nr:hypothetical protein [uncultured Roseovarius sp.]